MDNDSSISLIALLCSLFALVLAFSSFLPISYNDLSDLPNLENFNYYFLNIDGIYTLLHDGYVIYSSIDCYDVLNYLSTLDSGSVLFDGIFNFTETGVVFDSGGWSFVGSGNRSTIYCNVYGTPLFYFNCSEVVSGVSIRDLYFVGDDNSENHPIGLCNVSNFVVDNCVFIDVGDECVSVGVGCFGGVISNNLAFNSPFNDTVGSAFNLQGCSGVSVLSNWINGSVGSGICLEGITSGGAISDVIVSKNYIANVGSIGIYLASIGLNVSEVVVSENILLNCSVAGIRDGLSGSANCVNVLINGNYISGGGSDTVARGAIHLSKNKPIGIIITDNSVYNWNTSSINTRGIQVDSLGALISNNFIDGVGDSGVYCGAMYSVISSNYLVNCEIATSNGAVKVLANNTVVIGNYVGSGYRGIYLLSTSHYDVVCGNIVTGCTLALDNDGTGSNVTGNIGF